MMLNCDNVVHLDRWKEEHSPHAMFDGQFVEPGADIHRVIVIPIEALRRYVFENQLIEGEDNIALRCIVYDWLLAEGFIEDDEQIRL